MSSSVERRGITPLGGGLKKTKWKSMHDESVNNVTVSDDEAINRIGRWIEDCTGHRRMRQSWLEFLEDGVILCELIESIRPGIIKKINRVKNRFAYWENFSFFLESCRSLGLQEWQLFNPEIVLCRQSGKSPSKEPPEKKLQNIITTLYWLAQTVQLLPGYRGPELDLSHLINKSSTNNCGGGSTGSISTCGDSTPASTPEHKSLSISSPSTDYPPPSPGLTSSGTDSPLLWVRKLSGGKQEDNYHFTTPLQFDDNPNSQTSTGSTDEPFVKKRRETLTVRVEAINPPPACSADLVFVQGSTSSSVLSPTSLAQLGGEPVANTSSVHYSPNHLSNTFGSSDQIDNTGLLIDPSDYHSQVFTGVSISQDSSEPQYFSQRSETTFHVNLTQTSQPDNLSNSGTQLDGQGCYPSHPELPSISELANNSSPIDTFDLHHSNRPPITTSSQTQIEYSCSQEYSDRYSNTQLLIPSQQQQEQQVETQSDIQASNCSISTIVNNSSNFLQQETPSNWTSTVVGGEGHTSLDSSINSIHNNSSSSIIVVSYTSPSKGDSSSSSSCNSPEKRLPYRRYTSPQQRLLYTTTTTNSTTSSSSSTVFSSNNKLSSTQIPTDSEEGREEEEEEDSDFEVEMSALNRSSGRRQMRVVPTSIETNKENYSGGTGSSGGGNNGIAPGIHVISSAINIQLMLLPGEKTLGFSISGGDGSPVLVNYVTGDTPSSRAGLYPGDELLSVNHIPLELKSHNDILDILKQAVYQRKILLSVNRDKSSSSSFHESTGSEPIQNGTYSPVPPSLPTSSSHHLRLSLDLQRVNSGALPKHMTASKILYTNLDFPGLKTNNTTKGGDDLMEVLSDVNSTAVEIGSVDSHLSSSSTGGELNHSSSLHSVEQQLIEPLQDMIVSDTRSVGTVGKSQSVIELPIDTNGEMSPDERTSGDDYKRAYQSHSNIHRKTTKTESLPGIFRSTGSAGARSRGRSNELKSRSVSGGVLGLQNMSMEDVHCVSKLQMDQIWQEVESSSSLTSPQDTTSPHQLLDCSEEEQVEEDTQQHPLDAIITTTRHSPPPLNQDTEIIIPTTSITDDTIEQSKRGLEKETSTVNVRRNSSSNSSKGIDTLLNMLRSLNEKVGTYDEEEEFKMLEELLQSSKFKKAKDFHDRMKDLVTRSPEGPIPHTLRIVPHVRLLRHFLRENMMELTHEEEELRRLLRRPQVQASLFCHDKIATQDLYVPSTYFPKSAQDTEDIILSHSALDLHTVSLFVSQEAPLSRDVPCSRKENATIVYLQRSNRPLGCTIYKQGDSVYVGKLLKGCDAEQSCVLREGDELLEINGIALMGKSTDEIIRLMSGEAGKILAFTLIPVHDDTADVDYEEKYVRAHFSYEGEVDEEVPCKELSLSFTKGEILEISNQDDPDWWQARKVFDDGGESLPGLIPARQLQQKREVLRESYLLSIANEERNRRKSILSKFSRKKKKKIYYNQGPMSGVFQSVGHEVATYEDVVKLLPDYSRRRPIVLIGAPLVGRRTLMKKLIDSNPRHYSACTPHTTRPMRPGEMNGREYHFMSREEMESEIQSNKFLEYGESRGHLYGVSVKSVKRVTDSMRVPVLDLHPQALKVIGSSGLIPYVILIASPRLDRLQMTRRVASEKHRKKLHTSSSAEGLNKDIQAFTESELLQLCHASQEIQSEYGHYFDWVIVNDDFQVAADMLIEVARRIEEEPQWIPSSWVEEV